MLWIKSNNVSIKRRLLSRLFVFTCFIWVILSVGGYFEIKHEITELFDGELSQRARLISTLYAPSAGAENYTETDLVTAPAYAGGENYENRLMFQIFSKDMVPEIRSANAPEKPLVLLGESNEKFYTIEYQGEDFRAYVYTQNELPFYVIAAQELNLNSDIALEASASYFVFLLLLLPVLFVLLYLAVNKGLMPLKVIANQITQRSPTNLEPVDTGNVPEEIKGITTSLNHLFARLQSTFKRERQFISDASHELRTPLAGLKAQAQIAILNDEHVQRSLQNIVAGVDRTSRLANQLLALSRIETESLVLKKEQLKLKDTIDDVLRDLEKECLDKALDVVVNIDDSITVSADRGMLYILCRNIIENAIRYTHERTDITVDWDKGSQSLTVLDQGEGIEESDKNRVFDRFYRAHKDIKGSGLGLAIVQRICELHDYQIRLDNRNDTHGLKVVIKMQ